MDSEQWFLFKDFRFEASHVLPRHEGKCRRLHGHSWRGRVEVRGDHLQQEGPASGMVLDFGAISAVVGKLVESHLDHWHLNSTTELENPTSEELARWVFNQLEPQVPGLYSVEIEETCTSRCVYRREVPR